MIFKLSSVKIIQVVSLFTIALAISVTSCTKVATPAAVNAKFVGTWNMASICWYSNIPGDTATGNGSSPLVVESIGAGDDNNSLKIGVSVGYTNCYVPSYLTASANDYNFSIPIQSFSDKCGIGYLVSGTGTVTATGSTLTINTSVQSGGVTTSCILTGVKQ